MTRYDSDGGRGTSFFCHQREGATQWILILKSVALTLCRSNPLQMMITKRERDTAGKGATQAARLKAAGVARFGISTDVLFRVACLFNLDPRMRKYKGQRRGFPARATSSKRRSPRKTNLPFGRDVKPQNRFL